MADYEKAYGTVVGDIYQQHWYVDYVSRFSNYAEPFAIPEELEEDFDWQLLFNLAAASFSSRLKLVRKDDEKAGGETKPELVITVSTEDNEISKKVSELWGFQILRLFEIYVAEQIELQTLMALPDNDEAFTMMHNRIVHFVNFNLETIESVPDDHQPDEIIKLTKSEFDELMSTKQKLEDTLTKTKEKAEVFISYSSADRPFADNIYQMMEEEGIPAWYDSKNLDVGDVISDKISSGIQQSSFVLIIISRNSLQSNWVKFELDEAYDQHVKFGKVILPCLYGDIADEEIPNRLKKHKYADFRKDKEMAFSLVKRSIIRHSNQLKQDPL
ncbi:MAG: toll/interleukin-1 receptor domain-containing protein [Chitinophagaceae bacterium]|nr:toll/interleukin-1 receptor domain-containing protein [Chitinophagaceae bacterium]